MAESDFKEPGLQVVMKYFEMLMSLLYVALGIGILSKSDALALLPKKIAIPLGCILIAYGLFRGYRVYRRYF